MFKLNYSKNFIIAFIIFAFICYLPRHWGIDFGSLLCAIIGVIGLFFRLKTKTKPLWTEIFFSYLLSYSFVLFALTKFVNWQDNGYYFLKLLRAFFFYYVIYFFHYQLKLTIKDLLKLFLAVFGIHFVLVYLQYFPPFTLREFFLKLNPIYDPTINPAEYKDTMLAGKRVKGAMMGFDSAGIIIAYVVGLGLIAFKNRFIRIVFLILGFLGVIITSRTGAVVYLGIAGIYFLYQFINQRKYFWQEVLATILALVVITPLIFLLFPNSAFVTKTLHNSFEFIYSYQNTGHLKIESLNDTLNNHMVITKNDLSFFGHPEHQKAHPQGLILSAGQSDCGYLQILANFGIPNTLMIIGVHLFLIFNIFKKSKNIFDIRLIVLIMFLIACIKGPYFFGRMTYDLIILFFFVESLKNTNNEQIEFSL